MTSVKAQLATVGSGPMRFGERRSTSEHGAEWPMEPQAGWLHFPSLRIRSEAPSIGSFLRRSDVQRAD